MKFYPYKWVGAKSYKETEGGGGVHKTFLGSFYMVA